MVRIGLVVVLFASSAAFADPPTVLRSKDERYFAVDQNWMVDASASHYEFVVFDLSQGGKKEVPAKYDSTNCMTGDPSGEGNEDAAQCRKRVASESKSYETTVAKWRKAHGASEATAHRGRPVEGKLEGSAQGAKSFTADDTGFDLNGDGPTTINFEYASKGHPTHRGTLKLDGYGDKRVDVYWSNDGQWAFAVAYADVGGAVVPIAGSPNVDLLDGGAGGKLQDMVGALRKAGYGPAHQAKASSAHDKTEIFFMPGFEEDARQIAAALSVPADSVKPLSWATPFAITVAAGKQ